MTLFSGSTANVLEELPVPKLLSLERLILNLEMRMADIPQSVLDRVGNELRHYFIPLLALSEQPAEPHLKLVGSGTLVEIRGARCILTAAHVWDATKSAEHIHLPLTAARSSFTVPRDLLSAKMLWNQHRPMWGPDLALLEIPQPYLSTIAARKSFLSLPRQERRLSEYPPKTKKGLWMVMGMVEEFSHVDVYSEITTVNAHIQYRAFFSLVLRAHEHREFDYFDVSAKLALHDVPSSFGGVSGGGLWQVCLSKDISGTISWDGERHFRGVAFWQSAVSDARRVIRCHGPRSIFETAWKEWGYSKGG
jgi:hypothetical protein